MLVTHALSAGDFASEPSPNPAYQKSGDFAASQNHEAIPMAVVLDEEKNLYEEYGIIYEIDPEALTAKVVGYQPPLTSWVEVAYSIFVDGSYYTVTEIADYSFKDCIQLECVYFSGTVNEIGEGAFAGCDNLRFVEVIQNIPPVLADDSFPADIIVYLNPGTVKVYATNEQWNKFELVSISDTTNPFKFKIEEDGAGNKYASVIGIEEKFNPFSPKQIPSTISIDGAYYPVKEIADSAFYKSDLLGGGRFNSARQMSIFSQSPLKIGKSAFAESTLQSFVGLCTVIEEYAFAGCKYLINTVSTDSLISIGKGAYANCPEIGAFSLRNSKVTVVPDELFMGCTQLGNVELGNVTEIGAKAFKDTGVYGIVLPATLKKIGDEAFSGHFISVISLPLTPPELGENVFCYVESDLVVPFESETLYKSTEGWKNFEKIEVSDPSALLYEYDDETGEAKVCSAFSNIDPNVVIPSEVKTYNGRVYKVTGILNECFRNMIIQTVEIPETVKTIGDRAFQGCVYLRSVNLPDGLNYLGMNVFQNCESLTTITIPESLTEIRDRAFQHCKSLLSIKLHDGITKIGRNAFEYCESLEQFTFPAGLTEISQTMLSECYKLKNLYIPEHITSIGRSAFWGDKALETVNIPQNIKVLDSTVFYGCESLRSIKLPEGLTSIGNGVFGESGLESIVIPEGVKTIGSSTFYLCKNLKSVVLPESLEIIERNMFRNCSLEEIKIPAALDSIGRGAFSDCVALKKVHVDNLDHWLNISFEDETSNPLCNGAELIVAGQSAEVIELPEETEEVKDYAFAGMTSLVEVVIPEIVEKIGNGSFSGCEGLKEINIPETVGEIGKQAFRDCISMLQAVIGKVIRPSRAAGGDSDLNFATVDSRAFDGCVAMKDVTIGANVKAIGDSAFINCRQIATVNSYAMFAPEIDALTFEPEIQDNATLHVPEGYKDVYEGHEFWSAFANVVDDLPVDIAMVVKCNIESNTLSEGKTLQLLATLISGEPASGIVWSSSNPSVAEVNESGLVTAVSAGTATIYATAESGARGKCFITVTGDSGVDAVSDGNMVRVEGNRIIAPEGTRIFDVAGAEVGGKTLRPGVYFVCVPDFKPVKVVVK